jgi:hypothetical protein
MRMVSLRLECKQLHTCWGFVDKIATFFIATAAEFSLLAELGL